MAWRDYTNRVIKEVFEKHNPETEEEAKKLLREAYPFGERAMHPYKIWLSAVKKALSQRYGKTKPGQQMQINEGLFGSDNN